MNELRSFTMKDVFAKIALADDEFDEWLANIGLLHSRRWYTHTDGTHTQNVESQWQKVKRRAKKQFGDSRTLYATYLPEYMWLKRFGEHENVFYNFWSQVAELYPCE